MLADDREADVQSGRLHRNIFLPAQWRVALLNFIAAELPKWRDDVERPFETAETSLTSQFCAHMNSATRMSKGWDFLQFRTEVPDEVHKGRAIDLAPAPSAATIWIEGREYSQYASLLPIECKRLPTPAGTTRDEREYLFSAHSSTGGVQRFKAGHHGAVHTVGAMIGYIQDRDVAYWTERLRAWLEGLIAAGIPGWSVGDQLHVAHYDQDHRSAILESSHERLGDLPALNLHHFWIEMPNPNGDPTDAKRKP